MIRAAVVILVLSVFSGQVDAATPVTSSKAIAIAQQQKKFTFVMFYRQNDGATSRLPAVLRYRDKALKSLQIVDGAVELVVDGR